MTVCALKKSKYILLHKSSLHKIFFNTIWYSETLRRFFDKRYQLHLIGRYLTLYFSFLVSKRTPPTAWFRYVLAHFFESRKQRSQITNNCKARGLICFISGHLLHSCDKKSSNALLNHKNGLGIYFALSIKIKHFKDIHNYKHHSTIFQQLPHQMLP